MVTWDKREKAVASGRNRTGLDNLAAVETYNVRVSRRLLRGHGISELSEHIVNVYLAVRDMVERGPDRRRKADDVIFSTMFLLRSCYVFEKGLVEVMRGHLSDSLTYLRDAVEAAGFVDVVRRDRPLARTWVEASTDEERYELYRKRFRTSRLFPDADPLMRRLGSLYDWASKAVHASPYSFALRFSVEQDGTVRQFAFGYMDFVKRPQEAERDVLSMFMTHISAHLAVLRVLARALRDVVERTTWDLHFNTAEGLFEAHRDRLTRILRPPAHRPSTELTAPVSMITPVRSMLWTPEAGRPVRS